MGMPTCWRDKDAVVDVLTVLAMMANPFDMLLLSIPILDDA